MRHFTIFIISLFLSLTTTNAQDASSLLQEVDAKVKSYKNIAINFKYSLSNKAANLQQETRGNITLAGEKYVLNLIGTTQLYDGNKLHVISEEDEEITISTPEEGDNFTPSKMLSFYKDGYKSELDIVQNIKGRKIQYIKLTPTKKSDEIKSVLLGIDKITKHIYKLIISQHNNTEIIITVNQFKTNQPLSNTLFVFDKSKYSNYYINDLD